MIQQEVGHKKWTMQQGVGIVLVILVALILTHLVISTLIHWTGIGLFDALYIVVAALMVYRIMISMLRNDRYTWDGETLTLQRRYGDTPRGMLPIPATEMLSLVEGTKPEDIARYTDYTPDGKPTHYLMYLDGAVRCAVGIAPNEELEKALMEGIAKQKPTEL